MLPKSAFNEYTQKAWQWRWSHSLLGLYVTLCSMHKSVVQPQVIPDVCWTSLNNHANLLWNDVCPWLMEQIWAHAFSYSKIINKGRKLRSRLIAKKPEDIVFHLGTLHLFFSFQLYSSQQISTRFPSLIFGKMGHNKKMSTGTADYRRNAPEGASIWNFDSVKIWTWTIHDQWCHLMSLSCHFDIILDVILPMRFLFWSMPFNAAQ